MRRLPRRRMMIPDERRAPPGTQRTTARRSPPSRSPAPPHGAGVLCLRGCAMATFVLVPGAWCGGWVFRHLAPYLCDAGHEVYTPTVTGLGERVHLASPDVTLDTHITDIVNVLAYEDLHDAVLVGWSYGGTII